MKHKSKLTLLFTVSMLMLSSCTDPATSSESKDEKESSTSSVKSSENSSNSSSSQGKTSSKESSSSESSSSSKEDSSSSSESSSSSSEESSSSEGGSSSDEISSSEDNPTSSEDSSSSESSSSEDSSEEPEPEPTYYLITFNTMGGNEIPSQKVKEGELVTKPDDPTKENYIFDGWYLSDQFKKAFDFETIITTDYTLFAKWKEENPVDPEPEPDPTPDVTLVDYWIAGDFCSWSKDGAIQMEENPDGTDLAMKLGVEIEEGKCFKITNFADWYGYREELSGLATYDNDGNIVIKETATYNIYLNCNYEVWIEKTSSDETGGGTSTDTEKGDTESQTSIHAPDGSSLVEWYILGSGSLWEDATGWTVEGGVQLYSNPTGTDLACILNLDISEGDIFKISDGDSTWLGYSNVDSWDDPSNLGKNNFESDEDSDNFVCKISGTYNIYLNEKDGNKNIWISSAVTEEE